MDPLALLILVIATLFCAYMAWNIGANDVANAMGTSVGSKALTLKGAVIVAAIFEFSGAFFIGSRVTDTIRRGMVDTELFAADPMMLVYGMLAALLAAAVWLNIASKYGLPVSTTHAIVGAVTGFGIVAGGWGSIHWGTMAKIALSWLVSPLSGGIMAFALFTFLNRKIINAANPFRALRFHVPILVFAVVTVIGIALFHEGLASVRLQVPLWLAVTLAVAVGLAAALAVRIAIVRITERRSPELLSRFNFIEYIFKYLQIMTACYVAFAHGSNDVANAVGPYAAIVSILQSHSVAAKTEVPVWILGMGGIGIVIGLATYGYKVIETIGRKITELTPSRGFAAEFGTATTVLICSNLGIPISTTHTLVGAVIGIGFARGISALDFRIVRNIFSSWFITLPATMLISIVLFVAFRYMFGA
ncbi:MAG: inorganic phosphate transporter [Acidobacteria bacterium]|nr:inorganic phosphate transporter [Acidobacteriota bacterium]